MIYIEKQLKTQEDLYLCFMDVMHNKPLVIGHDTETTGLHIKYDNPFLFVFGFITNDNQEIYTYIVDMEKAPVHITAGAFAIFNYMFYFAEVCLAHNITFDMHMEANGGYPIDVKHYPKLMDTQAIIRLANDAIPERFGGVPLALKDYVYRFIDKNARIYEHNIKSAIKKNRLALTKDLLTKLKLHPLPEEYKITGRERNWTKAIVEDLTKDAIRDTDFIPEPYKSIIEKYYVLYELTSRYDLLDREMVIEYAHKDVRYLFQIYMRDHQEVLNRGMENILQNECKIIPDIYKLERVGRYIDLPYAIKSKALLKAYILNLRKELITLAGEDITSNQHKELKRIFLEKYGETLPSTGKEILEDFEFENADASRLAEVITELRSKVKWYTTYILSWTTDAIKYNDNKIYPQYNPNGAVTGRTSSPFQQFPREGMTTLQGETLFIPRKLFIVPEGMKLYYLDYSAMELRVQAIYTMLLGDPDTNLCRAFIPYDCTEIEGKWYLNEDLEVEWHKTDPHIATYAMAYDIAYEDVTKKQRYIGKRANFALIYGIGVAKLSKTLKITVMEAQALRNAYYQLYPKVRNYENYVRHSVVTKGYAENLFGRRYYGIDPHKGKNYLIQGSCADYTKMLFPDINKAVANSSFITEGYLHDEFSFRGKEEDEQRIIPKARAVMQILETELPMLADLERAETDWSEKHDYRLP